MPRLREQAQSLITLRHPWLVDQVNETVYGLGMLNLVREVAVNAARVFDAVRQDEGLGVRPHDCNDHDCGLCRLREREYPRLRPAYLRPII